MAAAVAVACKEVTSARQIHHFVEFLTAEGDFR
jgi:hypothetical protein